MLTPKLESIRSMLHGKAKERNERSRDAFPSSQSSDFEMATQDTRAFEEHLLELLDTVDKIDDQLKDDEDKPLDLPKLFTTIFKPASQTCSTCSKQLVACGICGRTTKQP